MIFHGGSAPGMPFGIPISPGVMLLNGTAYVGDTGRLGAATCKDASGRTITCPPATTAPAVKSGPDAQAATATGWIRQKAPNAGMECRYENGKPVQCRTAGSSGVKALQQALTALATLTGNPAIDPKGADGIIGLNTRIAVAAGLAVVAPTLSSDLKWPALALAAAAVSGQATAR